MAQDARRRDGIKMGVDEIDILAIKPANGGILSRHLEVQASFNPVSYLTKVPKARRLPGQGAGTAKRRSQEELHQGVQAWIRQKFDHPKKIAQRKSLFDGVWTRELVVHKLKHPEELNCIREAGITAHELADVIATFRRGDTVISKAAGADFVELVTGFDLSFEPPVETGI